MESDLGRTAEEARIASLQHALEHAAHFLPAQAPLDVFVHHNTLHAYQHLHFHDAVAAAESRTGARGYLSIDDYRAAFARERIRIDDLDAAIADAAIDVGASGVPGLPSPFAIVRSALLHDVRPSSAARLAWELAEHDADRRFAPGVSDIARARIAAETGAWLREELEHEAPDLVEIAAWVVGSSSEVRSLSDVDTRLRQVLGIALRRPSLERAIAEDVETVSVSALWTACQHLCARLEPVSAPSAPEPRFARDLLVSRGHEDPNDLVGPTLIPACATFLDRGQSHWSMPDRDLGFFDAWSRMLTSGKAVRPAWLADLGERLRAWRMRGLGAGEVALLLLDELGIGQDELDAFVEHTLLQLPGWAGMFHQLENAPGPIGRSRAKVTLLDFFVVRLVLDAQALRDLGRRAGHRGPLARLRSHLAPKPALRARAPHGYESTAWPVFLLAQHAGISAPVLWREPAASAWLLDVVRALDDTTRLRIWHESYERRYREQLLRAVSTNVPVGSWESQRRHELQSYQVVFCIDDREESIRRHFEELSAKHGTFGAAGFFGLAIAYQGIDDPSTFPLCPVVVQPRHQIEERATPEHAHLAESRRRWRKRLGRLESRFDRASRSIVWGPFLTALVGAWTAIPLLVEVFAPRLAGRARRAATRRLLPELRTELTVPRASGDDGPTTSLLEGFSVEEKASRVGTLLENMGLTKDFAPIVAIVGHDSSSVNNPHFAAYSCGACGGRSGGPNARLFARMANRDDVRELLRARGIDIPATTLFVGGVHDTCADTIRFYDVESIPEEHAPRVADLQHQLEHALANNAHERCRKLESAPRRASAEVAHEHVEGRSVDLSQPRPELGHATNAGCVVGRRALTRSLFLDRRVFLVSYDPTIDPRGEILERILLAVGPVCAGINLEYFFSTTDNEKYGAGTKLPHNVTGLVGVMNGACSDLRTGLPRQMIEIHEPIRLQLVVETDEGTLRGILLRQPSVRELVENGWVVLALCEPATGEISVFRPGRSPAVWSDANRLPVVRSSADWYEGHSDFVPPARVEPSSAPKERVSR